MNPLGRWLVSKIWSSFRAAPMPSSQVARTIREKVSLSKEVEAYRNVVESLRSQVENQKVKEPEVEDDCLECERLRRIKSETSLRQDDTLCDSLLSSFRSQGGEVWVCCEMSIGHSYLIAWHLLSLHDKMPTTTRRMCADVILHSHCALVFDQRRWLNGPCETS